MDIIYRKDFNKIISPTVITIGMFDGLHLGHESLINTATSVAKANNYKSLVFTFEKAPLNIIKNNYIKKNILSLEEKLNRLSSLNIDYAFLEDFNIDFQILSPKSFVEMLIKDFNMKTLIVGYNFKFGHENIGNIETLKYLSNTLNFELIVIPKVSVNNIAVSSTNIRTNISNGNIDKANAMLNKHYIADAYYKNNRWTLTSKLMPKKGIYTVNIKSKNEIYTDIRIKIEEKNNFELLDSKLSFKDSTNFIIEFIN